MARLDRHSGRAYRPDPARTPFRLPLPTPSPHGPHGPQVHGPPVHGPPVQDATVHGASAEER
eukprot:3389467-Rhodomonas_salina.1